MDSSGLIAAVIATARERERATAILAPVHAPEFNPVALLAPGENALSAAFRWMLDERADHGQGALFRDLFLRHLLSPATGLDWSEVDWSGANVRCEVPTNDGVGRIDLLIEAPGRAGSLIVENKPWAGWQDRQLERYWQDRSAPGAGPVWVHALIGSIADAEAELDRHWRVDGRTGAAPPRPDRITASSYAEVAGWLEACAAAARPDRVRHFLFDLAAFCRRTILKEPAMSDRSATAALIADGGASALDAAREIEAALPDVYRLLTERVAERLGGTSETLGRYRVLHFERGGVSLGAGLFNKTGDLPWIGVTSAEAAKHLSSELHWEPRDGAWIKWAFLYKIDSDIAETVLAGIKGADVTAIAAALPLLADEVIGSPSRVASPPR